jgi:hypothetical protein
MIAEEPKSFGPLVSQGARSERPPLVRERTPDDLIRSFRSDRSIWTRIL